MHLAQNCYQTQCSSHSRCLAKEMRGLKVETVQGKKVSLEWTETSGGFWECASILESVPEPEDSSPGLTWILGYFWSLPWGVSPRLEWGHASALSSRAIAAVSRFPSRASRDMWLSLEAIPGGFHMRLSHRAVPRATVM